MKLRYQRVSLRGGAQTERQLERMLDYLWDASRRSALSSATEWRPPLDVYETEGEVCILAELAGMDEEEIEVTLFEDLVLIAGERRPSEPEGEEVRYQEAGVRYGRFVAEVPLPSAVDPDRVRARYERGFLEIHLPRSVVSVQPSAAPTQTIAGGVEQA